MKRVAVIGGGVSGLCAARRLKRDGRVDVVLLEASDRLGGVIRSTRRAGYLYEGGANAFLPEQDGAVDLADELNVVMAPAGPAAKKRWIYVDGAVRQLPTNPLEAVTTNLLSWRGKLRVLAEPLPRPAPAGDESVAAFARRRLGAEVARKIIAPFVTGVFAGDAELLSLRSAFPMLAELDDRGGLVRGMIARRRDSRRPRKSRRLTAPVAGAQALVDAVAAELGDISRVNATVTGLERRDQCVALSIDGDSELVFDAVVLATPAHAAAKLLEPLSVELSRTLLDIPYVSVVVVHLGFDRSSILHPLDGFGVITAKGEAVRLLGVVLESVLWQNRAPAGQVLIRCIFGGQRDPEAIDETDEVLVSAARDDLRTLLNIDAPPVQRHISRQHDAIAQYTLGHATRVDRAEALAEPLGIVLAGSAYHGVSVNKCIANAGRVAGSVYRLLQPALLCLVPILYSMATGCSSKSTPEPGQMVADDARVTVVADARTDGYTIAPVDGNGVVKDSGTLMVTVDWLKAPAELRGSSGRTRCKTRRRPPVAVHTNGGVRDIVVSVLGIKRGKSVAPAAVSELAIRHCELVPPVIKLARLGATLAIINDDERRHDLVVEKLGGDIVATIPLAVIGRRYELVLRTAGILRVRDVADANNVAYVVVPAHPYVGVTSAAGTVELKQLPAGTYKVEAWQRPLTSKQAPRRVVGSVAIAAGTVKKLELSLAP